jgi:hypothetical protein
MTWFDSGVSVVLVCLGLLHLLRVPAARPDGRPAPGEAAHAAMALGMAAMFWPAADPLPTAAWSVFFGLVAAWFTSVALRRGPAADDAGHHVLCALAMLYMFSVEGAAAGGGEHAPHVAPDAQVGAVAWTSILSIALIGYFALHGMRCADRWGAVATTRRDSLLGFLRAPRTGAAAQLITTSAMAAMLLVML